MKKSILNIGKALDKTEQQSIHGGTLTTWGCGSSTCGPGGGGTCGQNEECAQIFCGPYGSADANGWEFVYQCVSSTNHK